MKNIKFKIIKTQTDCQFVLTLQLKPKLDRTKPSTRPRAVRGPRVGQSCFLEHFLVDFQLF